MGLISKLFIIPFSQHNTTNLLTFVIQFSSLERLAKICHIFWLLRFPMLTTFCIKFLDSNLSVVHVQKNKPGCASIVLRWLGSMNRLSRVSKLIHLNPLGKTRDMPKIMFSPSGQFSSPVGSQKMEGKFGLYQTLLLSQIGLLGSGPDKYQEHFTHQCNMTISEFLPN